jgi:hypothetical protein
MRGLDPRICRLKKMAGSAPGHDEKLRFRRGDE